MITFETKDIPENEPKVYCSNCEAWMPLEDCEFLNVEEGFHGADIITFKCWVCKQTQKSIVTTERI